MSVNKAESGFWLGLEPTSSSCRGRPKSTNCEMASYKNSIWKYSKSFFLFQWPSTSVRAIQPFSYKGCAWSRQVVLFTVSKWKQKTTRTKGISPSYCLAADGQSGSASKPERRSKKSSQTSSNISKRLPNQITFLKLQVWRLCCRRAQPSYNRDENRAQAI